MSISIRTHSYSIVRNTSGGRLPISCIVLHYTATDGATAENEIRYFGTNPSAVNASADFFVDDNEIWQYNIQLDRRYSWAVGVDYSGGTAPFWGKCTNANSVSIEMCCTYGNDGKWRISDGTYSNALTLTKYLMEKYNISPDNVIRHWDVCGKACPGAAGWIPACGESTWQKFKAALGSSGNTAAVSSSKTVNTPIYRVRRSANDGKTQIGAYSVLHNAKAQADNNPGYNVYDMSGKLVYTPKIKGKTVTDIAKEVISGKWGNGSERKQRLEAAGYDYDAVQAEVNSLMR